MTPEQQRIAIAEACGIVYKNPWGSVFKTPKGVFIECPDYCNDLNEMHEAEKILTTKDLWESYKNHMLIFMTEPVCATAAQRAEAFLRTVGKWTTNPNEQ